MVRAVLKAAFIAGLMLAACAGSSAARENPRVCGPFGDPPADTISAPKPYCWGAGLRGPWHDANGTERYACINEPQAAAENGRFPLIVYLHPSLFGTATVHATGLLRDLNSFSFGAVRSGYIVLEPLGRKTTHFYPFPDRNGLGWDNWYRQLNPAGGVEVGGTIYRENVDAAAIDHFIAEEIAAGKVDPARVYIIGWSNGAAMGLLYALNRP